MIEDDNEFDKVRKLLVNKEQLKERKTQIESDTKNYTDLELRKNLK